ncbi:tetratricopeptide repeat-containing protein [Novosphingobium aquiterrae]|uniref:Tetratricopeptide repeat-containing protein n=1 Tax=Novosphingobium aquiterrae TaxID=624388 RepID=A0ABV6PKQ4_9SPHN
MRVTLPAIAAMVRAGAVERAWELFVGEGHADRRGDAATEAVRGRLFKARARLTQGREQAQLFAEAARAYSAANVIDPAPYLAINAATLSLLAQDDSAARTGARQVIAMLDSGSNLADTPYYLAATRAEAALLLGDQNAAEAAMDQAATHDPDGWRDRATTIAQLREITAVRGDDATWLIRFAPPASLHFAGHMGLASGGNLEAQLARQVDALIAAERIGFAWGALAAGADIIIAERLLAAGVELHLVLPCAPDTFEGQSVHPAGQQWSARYRSVLARANSLRLAAADAGAVHDPIATAHAGELAIGATLLNASELASTCCQLIVTDADGGGRNTARQAAMWPAGAGPQHHLTVARDAAIEALFPPERSDPYRALAVHVAIELDGLSHQVPSDPQSIERQVLPISRALARMSPHRVRAAPGRWDLVLDDVPEGLATLLDVQANCRAAGMPQPAIGAHIAIASLVSDAASGALVPYGPGMTLARRLMAMAPSGTILITDALAVTMAARRVSGLRSELYHTGDDDSAGPVHVLLPGSQ